MFRNRVKTKIILAVIGIIAVTMIISSAIVSFIIYQQNRDASYSLLRQSSNILRDDIDGLTQELLKNARQAATANDMGANIEFAASVSYKEGESMGMKSTYQAMSQGLYNIAQAGNIWKAAIYNKKNQLSGFTVIEGDQGLIGFPRTSDFLVVNLNRNEQVNPDAWKPLADFSGFDRVYKGEIPKTETADFKQIDAFITLVAKVPIVTTAINEKTQATEQVPVGTIVAVFRFDKGFIERLSRITGNRIGIIKPDNTITGDLSGYPELNPDTFGPVDKAWNIQKQPVILNDISMEKERYFQGLLPIFAEDGYVGALTMLHSMNVSMNNTLHVVGVLSLVSLGCIILFFPLAFFASNSFSKPLEELSRVLSDVEQTGDFSHRVSVNSRDEIGQTSEAFNHLMDALQEAIGNVNNVLAAVAKGDLSHSIAGNYRGELSRLQTHTNDSIVMLGHLMSQVIEASQQVNTGALELSHSAQVLANGTTQQAATLEEVASSMDEIETRTKANRDNANQARVLTDQTIEIVKNGNHQMESMLASMKRINESSSQVSKVIKTIDEIAFQTNLLALNAAVEAARAGKYGKGFAVVAEEVRSLAARSAAAAKDTTELIESSIKEVEKGVQNADSTASVLERITEGINQSNTLINEISAASVEQANSVTEINKGLTNVNTVVQQNSSISEQAAAASEELSGQAARLQEMMNLFVLSKQFLDSDTVLLLEES
ncbi:MAG: methyl-accepting chemotaxis protein [bacterium]